MPITPDYSPLQILSDAVSHAGLCGAEVILPIPAINRIMLQAGHSVSWKWDDLAAAIGAVVTYDTALRMARLAMREESPNAL